MFLVFYLLRNIKAAFNAEGPVVKLGSEHKFRSLALLLFLHHIFQTLCDYSVIEKCSLFHLNAETRVMYYVRFLCWTK